MVARILGLQLLAHIGQRWPGRSVRAVSAAVLTAANLVPIAAVARGAAGVGDLYLLYWLETLMAGAVALVCIGTATAPSTPEQDRSVVRQAGADLASPRGRARFFLGHYSAFVAVHGIFTCFVVVLTDGLTAPWWYWVVALGAIGVSHLVWLQMTWFGQGQRSETTPVQAMVAPYPRIFALHLALLAVLGLAVAASLSPLAAVSILCVAKVALDLVLRRVGPIRIELH